MGTQIPYLKSLEGLPVLDVNPKISKGEKYNDLPYVVLDFPAFFAKTGVFALRSFFLWGRGFVISLHISGDRKPTLKQSSKKLPKGVIIYSDEEWKHERPQKGFYSGMFNAKALSELNSAPHIKISYAFPFDEKELDQEFKKGYKKIVKAYLMLTA